MNIFHDIIPNLRQTSILVIGDIMLDRYIYGSVDRVSPEAPIPVLKTNGETVMLGGAGNVVRNLSSIGVGTTIVGITGKDNNDSIVRGLLDSLPTTRACLLRCENFSTVTKTRFVAAGQQIMRADEEKILPYSMDIEHWLIEQVTKAIPLVSGIILSDYNKGVLSRPVCKAAIEFSREMKIPVFVDPKGEDYSIYNGATLVKPNIKELGRLFGEENVSAKKIDYCRSLIKTHDLTYCLLTMGRDGMTLVSSEEVYVFPAKKREVYDVSGAGDTVIATLASLFCSGASIEHACAMANIAGGIAVGKLGTSMVTLSEIQNELSDNRKILTENELTERISTWRNAGYKIGFTNGCFDLLHAGHINTLQFARKHCDKLIVGLNSDSSILRLKGPKRPIINEQERAILLSSLEFVSTIVLFNDDTPEQLIKLIKPDVLVKGYGYKKEDVVGYHFIRSYGGEVEIAPRYENMSTTSIIGKILANP